MINVCVQKTQGVNTGMPLVKKLKVSITMLYVRLKQSSLLKEKEFYKNIAAYFQTGNANSMLNISSLGNVVKNVKLRWKSVWLVIT